MMARSLSWLLIATHVPATGAGGGMVRYAVEMATNLAARSDVDLVVLARPESRTFFRRVLADTARVAVTPSLPTPARSALERSGHGVDALRKTFDVVHGTKHLLPRHSRGHPVLTVHDLLTLDAPDEFNLLKRVLLKPSYRASLKEAGTLLCVSGATRNRLEAHLPSAREKATVVPLAASTALTEAESTPLPELVGREFALVVGDSSRRKNLGFVIDLWPDVLKARPGSILAVVGPPSWGASHLGTMHGQLARQGHLTALGYLADGQLRWCYENASVVLCPSLLEGFGLPAAEALAFGAPLITSLDPALCEVSGTRAAHLSTADPTAWCTAIVRKLSERSTASRSAQPQAYRRTWNEVAAETVAAVRASLS